MRAVRQGVIVTFPKARVLRCAAAKYHADPRAHAAAGFLPPLLVLWLPHLRREGALN
jgi:hypothetical protein